MVWGRFFLRKSWKKKGGRNYTRREGGKKEGLSPAQVTGYGKERKPEGDLHLRVYV